MDRTDSHDAGGPRDPRNVLPRLADRTDAIGGHVNHALDIFDTAQPLPVPHSKQSNTLSQPGSSLSTSLQNSNRHYFQQQEQSQQSQPPLSQAGFYSHPTSSSDSQDTTSSVGTSASTHTDQLFTPPISEGGLSVGGGDIGANGYPNGANGANGHLNGQSFKHDRDFSNQDSQLLQLSELAAARALMADVNASNVLSDTTPSRKRTADGTVKHTRDTSTASAVYRGGHSRNTSAVSVASTAGSRIGELSAELKTRLSYAMVKVNNGWQSHSIDQVESLASQASSPTSSTASTINGRRGTSASPHITNLPSLSSLPNVSHHRQTSQASVSSASTAIALPNHGPPHTLPPIDTSLWTGSNGNSRTPNTSTPPLPSPLAPPRAGAAAHPRSLAPPVSIQPSAPPSLARSSSNPGYASTAALPRQNSPHTPNTDVLPLPISPHQHQNVREQDAIETLLFMSSPGNSANMKHFPTTSSASQPLPSGYHTPRPADQLPPILTSPQRHALPSSAPRKSLPTSRPGAVASSHGRRGAGTPGHHRYASDMDIDETFGTPYSARSTPRRRGHSAHHSVDFTPHLKVPLSMPSGLSGPSKPRPVLGEEDIERMLDRAAIAAADDSSDSESEIQIPVRRINRVGI